MQFSTQNFAKSVVPDQYDCLVDATVAAFDIASLVGAWKAIPKILASGGISGTVPKGGGQKLFRVVDDVELADIRKTGAFRNPPGGRETKQFIDNLGDANKLQKRFADFFGGNQTVVRSSAPKSVLDDASRTPFADIPGGRAVTIPNRDLPLVKPDL